MELNAYGHYLTVVLNFNYLGWVLLEPDNECPEVSFNLRREWKKWALLSWAIRREGADARTSRIFYTTLVQVVLLYRSESWVMSTRIGKTLGGFQHRLKGRITQRNGDGTWTYPPLEEAMVEEGMQEVETYIDRHQNTATEFIATWPIMDLCLAAVRRPRVRFLKRWWKQDASFTIFNAEGEGKTIGVNIRKYN